MKKFALSRLNAAVMKGLCYSSVAATLAVAPHTLAQEEENDETASVERVMVTGSRIARDPNLASPSPVQAIEAKDIRNSGEFSITDVVNDIPALLSSVNSESANDGDAQFADGTNLLNLRGMDSRRTLVLVNGRRHVGGAGGTSSVDVGSIPAKLIESVEVLTGGASAIYGADAVTGVVNFIMKKDFQGFDFDVQQGVSSEGDAQQLKLSATYGLNFDNDKGNVAISVEYADSDGLKASERDNGIFIGSGRDWVNPAKRFQQGDIDALSMPNFAQYFNPDNGRPFFGLPVPADGLDDDGNFISGEDAFIAAFMSSFGYSPTLTGAELAFIDFARNAPARAVLPGRTFPFTSGYGYIIPGNPWTFSGFDPGVNIDLDHNGIPDCYDSFTGFNSSFGPGAFGVLGGCWVAEADGTYRPIRDGLIASGFQGFGGDSFNTIAQQNTYLLTPEESINVNVLGSYEVGTDAVLSWELKYTEQEVVNTTQPTSFWDLLFGAPDNPYLPEFIRPVAEQTGGVAITIDPIGMGDGLNTNERTTMRAVLGLNGSLDNGWTYDASVVWGKFEREQTQNNAVINDRFMAAIDAVIDPDTGEVACRADVDPSTPAQGTPFNIPDYEPGYYTFTPGAGSCVPLNIWAGAGGISQAAVDWVTATEKDTREIEQLVLSASLAGDFGDWFELPAGVVSFATGLEYRDEKSKTTYDDYQLGILPAESPFGAGTNIEDVSGDPENGILPNRKLTFRPKTDLNNADGGYDVAEVYLEVSVPLLEGKTFAEELTIDGAIRYSDYSTIGSSVTWKTNLQWAPIEDLTIRYSLSEAVRAPNISEYFDPVLGVTFRPADPCDVNQINALRDNGQAELASSTQANCVADFATFGLDPFDENGNYVFEDPLSAAFGGETSGNQELIEETADTTTIGFVYRPEFLDGFNLTVDYWSIEIENAISELTGDDIARGCYEGSALNTQFCELLSRNTDSDSIFFGGFNYMRAISINFAEVKSDGYDFAMGYDFNWDEHEIGLKLGGSKVNEVVFINDLGDVDNELGEARRPEWAGNFNLDWTYGDLTVGWQTQYQGEQLLNFVEIDTAMARYGDAVFMDETFVHDINFSFQASDEILVYGGINNVTDEEPFITSRSLPASVRGRYFFLGLNFSIE